jgi:hypothetical protein
MICSIICSVIFFTVFPTGCSNVFSVVVSVISVGSITVFSESLSIISFVQIANILVGSGKRVEYSKVSE